MRTDLLTIEAIVKDLETINKSDVPAYVANVQDAAYNIGWHDGEMKIEREKLEFAISVIDDVFGDKWKAVDKRAELVAELHKVTPTIGPTLLDQ